MKIKHLLTAVFAVLIGMGVFGAPPAWSKTLLIRVDGMICDFCATGMKKKFGTEPGVTKVTVDLSGGLVTVETEGEADFSDERIQKLVDYSGNDFVSVTRK